MRAGISILIAGCYPVVELPPMDFVSDEHQTAVISFESASQRADFVAYDLTAGAPSLVITAEEPRLTTFLFERPADALGVEPGPLLPTPDLEPIRTPDAAHVMVDRRWSSIVPEETLLASARIAAPPASLCDRAVVQTVDRHIFSVLEARGSQPVYAVSIEQELLEVTPSEVRVVAPRTDVLLGLHVEGAEYLALDGQGDLFLFDVDTTTRTRTLLRDFPQTPGILAGQLADGAIDLFVLGDDGGIGYTRVTGDSATPWIFNQLVVDEEMTPVKLREWTLLWDGRGRVLIGNRDTRFMLVQTDGISFDVSTVWVGDVAALHDVQSIFFLEDGAYGTTTSLGVIWRAEVPWDWDIFGRTGHISASQVARFPALGDTYLLGSPSRTLGLWDRDQECFLPGIAGARTLAAVGPRTILAANRVSALVTLPE